jgi:hypothetical protein
MKEYKKNINLTYIIYLHETNAKFEARVCLSTSDQVTIKFRTADLH